jgi:Protein of unknown function (Hypoth_ymh)
MNLSDLIPDADVLLALDPDELGLRILRALRSMPAHMQQHELGSFTNSVIGDPRAPSTGTYPVSQREDVRQAIREAWAWLEGQGLLLPDSRYVDRGAGPRVLSRRASRLATEPDPRRALSSQRLSQGSLHPKIREDVWALYHRVKYETAVFEAMKAVEVSVREAAGLSAKDIGTALMRKAFDPKLGRSPTRAQRKPSGRRDLICSRERLALTKTRIRTVTLSSMIQMRPQKSSCWQTICSASSMHRGERPARWPPR